MAVGYPELFSTDSRRGRWRMGKEGVRQRGEPTVPGGRDLGASRFVLALPVTNLLSDPRQAASLFSPSVYLYLKDGKVPLAIGLWGDQ